MIDKRIYSSSVFVVADNGSVLLIHHLFHKNWLPVGGRHESNETPLEAALRELREETGLVDVIFPVMRDAPFGTPPGFLGYEEHPGKGGTYLNFCFVARVPNPVAIRNIGPDDEFDSYDWFVRDDDGVNWRGVWRLLDRIADPMPTNVRDVLAHIDCVANTSGLGRTVSERHNFG